MDGSITIGIELEESGFRQALEQLRETARQTAEQSMTYLASGIGKVSEVLVQNAGVADQWGQRILGLFSQVVVGASNAVPAMQTMGTQAGVGFLQGMLSAFSSPLYFESGMQAGSQLYLGFQTGAGPIPAAAQSLAGRIRAAFSAGGWYSLGYNISAGVAGGISGGSGLIYSAAVRAAQSALAAAKKTLGVASPSRVFRDEVGRMIPAGIAQGVMDREDLADEAVRKQSRDLVTTARQTVIPAVGGAAAAGVVGPEGGGVHISLEAPLYIDGRELARATADYNGQQLIWEAM